MYQVNKAYNKDLELAGFLVPQPEAPLNAGLRERGGDEVERGRPQTRVDDLGMVEMLADMRKGWETGSNLATEI